MIQLKLVDKKTAEYSVKHWHYSKCMPAGKMVIFGVWENDKFIGVIIYSKGSNNNQTKFYNLEHTEICELTRIALNKHNENVSKMISISLKLLKKLCPKLKLVFSYAYKDQNHSGAIYKASNFLYLGDNFGKTSSFIINNKKVHRRTVNSILNKKNISASLENVKKYLDPNAKYFIPKGKHLFVYILDKNDKQLYNRIKQKCVCQ